MHYKDGEVMNLNHIAEVIKTEGKIPKKSLISILKESYNFLSKEQIASIIMLVKRMLEAKSNGENLTVAFRDWNEDGTRRF